MEAPFVHSGMACCTAGGGKQRRKRGPKGKTSASKVKKWLAEAPVAFVSKRALASAMPSSPLLSSQPPPLPPLLPEVVSTAIATPVCSTLCQGSSCC